MRWHSNIKSILKFIGWRTLEPTSLYRLFSISILLGLSQSSIAAQPVSPFVLADNALANVSRDPYVNPQTVLHRQQFAELVNIIQTSRRIDANDIAQRLTQLQGYALYPYAWKYWLLASLSYKSADQIHAFLAEYDGQPVARNVRKRWLQLLQDEKRNSVFVTDYRPGISAELDCYFLRQTLPADADERTLDGKISHLWMVPYSQPSACDPLFSRWKKAGLQTSERTLKRIKLATKEGNYKLARFLARSLKPQHKFLADLWRDAQRNPSRLTASKRFPMQFLLQEAEVFSYAMEKLAWSRPHQVIQAYRTLADTLQLNDQQRDNIVNAIALSLAVDQHPDAPSWLQKAQDINPSEEILRWQVATTVRQQQWQETLALIEQTPDISQQNLSYEYWKGRSWQQLSVADKAETSFNQAAKERHYYGFLASAQLGTQAQLNHKEPAVDDALQGMLIQNLSIQRAYELKLNDRFSEARREWRFALNEQADELKLQAALLAHHWEWFDQAILLFSELDYLDDVLRRFPVPTQSQFEPLANEYQVDQAWALAITRRESSFMVDAVSQVGARGLMQIMPTTANYLEKKSVRYSTLLEPERNLSLGMQYLNYLMQKVNNNPILATASYNAGWQRVLKWLPEDEAIDADVWIESIPFKETRNYVKAVLAYKHIYQLQLGQKTDVFEQVQNMQMPAKKDKR
ncbi:transglycosylase SLT domain-containing protein [Alteromonas facilis]|uniref:transglycosylase SLT domain-containing protein n=1 Tax=Alteromonas facilis TaxID=2048004 RepID=UPI000C289821|nr:transglycosylase SLT domain-containing protein [Alteromonas facilis]